MARLHKLFRYMIICVFILTVSSCSANIGDAEMANECGSGQVVRETRNIDGLELYIKGPERICAVSFGGGEIGQFSGYYDSYLPNRTGDGQTNFIVEVRNTTSRPMTITRSNYPILIMDRAWEEYSDGTQSQSARKTRAVMNPKQVSTIHIDVAPGKTVEIDKAPLPTAISSSVLDGTDLFGDQLKNLPEVRKFGLAWELGFLLNSGGKERDISEKFVINVKALKYKKP